MFKKGKKPEYKSPISVNCTNKERVYYVEEKIMDEVRIKLHVDVNKEELLKALAYDRNQYEKGYNDAKAIYGKALDKACRLLTYDQFNGLPRRIEVEKLFKFYEEDWKEWLLEDE